ncbi:TonB-dependent siderophore receptor [Lysobacteraceae bacterium NML120232]|nr:TonB-dependent siderophore receptor [Xanthomonadaceae bacterium NML120232]
MLSASSAARPFARSPLSLAIVCALLLPGLAAADTPPAKDPAGLLDRITVTAYRTATHAQGATKTDTPIAETAQSVSVIAREEMDARGAQNLNEIMRYIAGIGHESTGIDNRVDDFSIRGFDAGSWGDNVTLDGMRAPQGSQFNRAMFDSWNLERVEVLKGPSAVMYGQMAPGGMVNQVSKTPQPGQTQVVRLGLDGHGQYSAAFDFGGGSADNQHLFRLVGLYRKGPLQVKHSNLERWFIAPSYTLQMADSTRLTLLGLYQKDHGGTTYQFLPMAGTLVPTTYGRMKNSTFIGEPDWNTYNRTLWTAGWLFEHDFNDHWTLAQSARHTHVESLYRGVITLGALRPDGRTQNRRAIMAPGESDGQTIDTRLTGQFSTGALAHTLLLGVDWQKADWSGKRIHMNNPAPIDIFQPVYTGYGASGPVAQLEAPASGRNRQTGAYLQDQIRLGNWRFSLGGRYDWTDDDVSSLTRTLVGTSMVRNQSANKVKSEAFTARAGLMYVAANGLTPYYSYAESFQPANRDASWSYTGEAFKPVTGKQHEVGLKFQPESFDSLFTLSAYDLRQQNILVDDPDPTHNNCGLAGNEQCKLQGGEGQVRGLELEARATPLDGLSIIGAATRMRSKLVRGNPAHVGNHLPKVADWSAALWVDYTFRQGGLRGLSLAAGTRYNGKAYGESSNAFVIPSFLLWDAAIRYDLGTTGGLSSQVALNISNLADKVYVSTCTSAASCHYGSGRTINASLRLGW